MTVLKYLASHPNIPPPKLILDWADSGGRYFGLQARMKGTTLEKAWPSLSPAQKISIADQVVEVRKELRLSRRRLYGASTMALPPQRCFSQVIVFHVDRFTQRVNFGMPSTSHSIHQSRNRSGRLSRPDSLLVNLLFSRIVTST